MQTEAVEPFSDNWAYLRAELNWLDRILGLAVAQQRKEMKELEQLGRTRADRATSHWWKGLLNLEGEISYDSPVEMPRKRSARGNYQQQLLSKIRVSEHQGICLGLPSLQTRLQLNGFEKNLVLLTLAPEISRRYGRIYNYLQDTEQPGASGLPTVDLILRLLCRTDGEWRLGRQCLAQDSVLVRAGLLEIYAPRPEPLLTCLVKLADPLVSYLLASQPQLPQLDAILSPVWQPPPSLLFPATLSTWADLVLPKPLIEDLQHLCHRVQYADRVDQEWGFREPAEGVLALLVGAAGTGKTTAAQVIAHCLSQPLWAIDLALVEPATFPLLLEQIRQQAPPMLLLKSAEVWLGNGSPMLAVALQQLLHSRRQQGMTLFSTHAKQSIRVHWRRQLQVLEFPLPDAAARLQLWRQAVPVDLPVAADLDWEALARQFVLSGGEIRAIVRDAAIYAAAASDTAKLELHHLMRACRQSGYKRRC